MTTFLIAKNIKKKFLHPAPIDILKGISLEVEAGESVSIVGRSGEGKSTLLHILGTLEEPTEGELWLAGQQASKCSTAALRNHHIGFIFQSFHLLDDYTALENVLLPLWIRGESINQKSLAHKRAIYLLEKVGLSSRANFPSKLLSGGEKQRVSLARALIGNPTLLFADEPTGNLDRANADAIISLLIALTKEDKKALIVATHSAELAKLCDRRVELREGFLKEI